MKIPVLLLGCLGLASAALAQRPPAPPLPRPRPAAGEAVVPAPPEATTCKIVNGQVLDENNRPLVGASIGIVGTRELNSTNSEGYYNFVLPVRDEPAPVTLRFSAAGYTEQELPVAQCTLPVVTLQLLPGTRVKQGKRHYGKIVKVNDKRVK